MRQQVAGLGACLVIPDPSPSSPSSTTIVMVNIYLNVDGSPVLFLSIPDSDVQRLSIHPFRWLRFVVFSICGARGCLSATPDGPPVDYDSTSVTGVINLYYKPSGDCIFVDYEGLNDRVTSTVPSDCPNDFRDDIIARDGTACIVTRHSAEHCDAAHLIPRSKGDGYIQRVVEDRSSCYCGRSLPSISGIDDVQNGVLLTKSVHSMLAKGEVAFLKSPNYGINPTDIHRVDLGPERTDHFTLQRLKVSQYYYPDGAAALSATANLHDPLVLFAAGLNMDALFQGTSSEQGTGSSLPPVIILDYLYGVAAYKQWGRRQGNAQPLMEKYHREHYANIPEPPPAPPSDNGVDAPDPGDPRDLDYSPSTSRRTRRSHRSTRTGDVMAQAMDELNLVLMNLSGTTPQEVAKRREERMEEEERVAREKGRSKVMEWMKHTGAAGS
ncbi:hypothetical protein BJY52DRAFT_1238401 [Lactarius psammicola]|nr:hypothetical protein BJY52DRAFT_1238401 [Lactarius psammicola]